MKQLNTEAVNKCSGDQIPGTPLSNSGGVATSIFNGNVSEDIVPILPSFQFKET
jgi:hypothetical protein